MQIRIVSDLSDLSAVKYLRGIDHEVGMDELSEV